MTEPEQAPAVDPLIGQELGGAYRIERLIGFGGMGNVYEASHIRLPRRFGIKVVHKQLAQDSANYERFKREAEIASSLGNRHIVEVMDFNQLPDGSPYMVMEYLEGEDLAARLGRQGKLSIAETHHVFGQVVSGLAAAHARAIVHRDIKPENIFLCRVDNEVDFVKILDFGLSKIRGTNKRLTANLSVLGTPWYMSPEQARGDADLDHRTDIYALAVVLYQVLTGRVPFEGENVYGVLTQIATQPPPPPSELAPEIPKPLEAAILRSLAKDPAHRHQSVVELWDEVQSALNMPATRRSIPPGVERPARIPTPTNLVMGTMPTIQTSRDKVSARTSKPPGAGRQSVEDRAAAFPTRSSRLAIVAGILLGAVPVIGGGLYYMATHQTPEPVAAPAPPAQVSLRFELTPSTARVSVGGVAMASNPLVVARSEAPLEVTVEADGYASVTQQVARTQDQTVTVGLTKVAAPAPAAPQPPPVAAVVPTTAPLAQAVVASKPAAHAVSRDSSSSEVVPAIRPAKPRKNKSTKVDPKLMSGDDL